MGFFNLDVDFFKQNGEMTIPPVSPLMRENSFLGMEPESAPLPVFEQIKGQLPQPVWEGHPDHIACYWRTWELAFGNLRAPLPGTGFVSNFIDTAFNGCIFMWDTVFILMYGKYADRIFRFQQTLDNFYSHQHRDGFICREIEENTGKDHFTRHDPSATGPDVMPWCEWEYYLNFGDRERLARVFPPLMAYHRWMAEHHTWPDGTYFSSGWGCGMDNLPRHMPGQSPHFSHGHMIWVDACMQELLSCHVLLEMARVLNRLEFTAELEAEQKRLEAVINEKLWDEETGFYYDLWKTGQHNMVRHIGAFWALIAGCAPEDRAQRLIAYLQDEREFKSPHRVPALSKSHPDYAPHGEYWAGGVWPPTNYMVLKGLERYGYHDLAYEIGREHLDAVVEVFKKHNTVFENYAPEHIDNGKPTKGEPAKADFAGWSGLGPVSVLFEYVFGIKPDAARRKITWHVNLLEEHGIRKYPFGAEGELTLLCGARTHPGEKPQITVESNIPVTLEVIWGERESRQSFTLSVPGK